MLNNVLDEDNRRRDDLSDDDDDESLALGDNRPPQSKNVLQDLTFAGGDMTLVPKNRPQKKIDSIAAIRDYLEQELGRGRLYQAYPVLRDFGDDILFEEKSADLIDKLEFVMTEPEVLRYRNFFALLIFHDM